MGDFFKYIFNFLPSSKLSDFVKGASMILNAHQHLQIYPASTASLSILWLFLWYNLIGAYLRLVLYIFESNTDWNLRLGQIEPDILLLDWVELNPKSGFEKTWADFIICHARNNIKWHNIANIKKSSNQRLV